MTIELAWMRPEAPYMPIATAGLLALLERAGAPARAYWHRTLQIETGLGAQEVAELMAAGRLPDPKRIDWPTRRPQALGPSLRTSDDPVGTYRKLVAAAGPDERRLLRSLATDQAVDDAGAPLRTRLLRGAKSDLSAFAPMNPPSVAALAAEIVDGPHFGAGKSGLALGLVPEVQTFGGSVGRDASTVGAESPLLSLLLRHGVLALPPVGVRRAGRHVAGGPLIDDEGDLSWPRWSIACDLQELRALFAMRALHEEKPDRTSLGRRGVEAVYRSIPQQLSTTVAVFRWGARIV